MFHRKQPKETAQDINEERPHEHGRAMRAGKTITEGIVEAAADPSGSRLREETPDEPGKPEAVNLERARPVTTAARRREDP